MITVVNRIAGALLCFILLTACGKKGPLIYPEMLASAAVTSFSARQSGEAILVSFLKPEKDLAGRQLRDLAGFTLFRQVFGHDSEICRSCSGEYPVYRTITLDSPGTVHASGNRIFLTDTDTRTGMSYGYVVAPFSKDGTEGKRTEPLVVRRHTAPPPPTLSVKSLPGEIILEFSGTVPAGWNPAGTNIYRTKKGDQMPLVPVNREAATGSTYADTGLDRETSYFYSVRSLFRLPSGELVESLPSSSVAGSLTSE